MTEKRTPPLPDPLPRPSGGEGEKMSAALNTYPTSVGANLGLIKPFIGRLGLTSAATWS
jgi:hypothetical protein